MPPMKPSFFVDFKAAFEKLLALGCPAQCQPSEATLKRRETNISTEFLTYAMHGSVKRARELKTKGCDVHYVEASSGRSALHKSAFWGHIDMTNFLVKECKVDLNQRDYNGDTPLHDAARFGHIQVVQFLLACGADPSIPNRGGQIAAVLAQANGHEVTFAALIPRAKL